MRARAFLALVGFWLLARPSLAEGQVTLSARDHFELGVEASRHGDLPVALVHFEQAQRLTPNQTVLYNLGQTYSALGRPVEALAALEAYLEADAPTVDVARRREVEALARKNRERVGTLEITMRPADARVELDGVPAELGSDGRVRVATGRHLLTATSAGHHPAVLPVEVKAGAFVPVRLDLEPAAPIRNSYIQASCPIPDVSVILGEARVGRTPHVARLPVASGVHRLRFERRGYVASESMVTVEPNATTRVLCKLVPDAGLPASEQAELRVIVSESTARILVNGLPFRSSKLPLGPHAVAVSAPGFRPWSRVVTVRAGVRNDVQVSLEPTPEQERANRARTQRLVAYATGATGVALGAVATVLYTTNLGRYDDWRQDQRELSEEIAGGAAGPDQAERAAELQDEAASIQRTDDLALGLGVAGGVLLAVSIGLLVTGEAPRAPEREQRAARSLSFSF